MPPEPYPDLSFVIIGFLPAGCPAFVGKISEKDRLAGGPAGLAFVALELRCRVGTEQRQRANGLELWIERPVPTGHRKLPLFE